jgi:hypothetical protein
LIVLASEIVGFGTNCTVTPSRVRRARVRGAGIDTRKRCAALPEETLAILKHRAEEALATDGVARTRLGYDVLGTLVMDERVGVEGDA